MILVLGGRIQVNFTDEVIVLKPGDFLYFDASTPHCRRSLGKKLSHALVVVSALGA